MRDSRVVRLCAVLLCAGQTGSEQRTAPLVMQVQVFLISFRKSHYEAPVRYMIIWAPCTVRILLALRRRQKKK